VDRKALPAPDASVSGSAYVAPEGVTEELLAELWCLLLKRERVGRHDNFFELGGHSLLATQLVSRLGRRSRRSCRCGRCSSTQRCSRRRARWSGRGGVGVLIDLPVEAVSREQPLSLSYAQQRLWFLHQYMGPNAVYNVPLALRLQGEVDAVSLVRSLEELHRRHESLRTRFEARDDSAVQVIDPPGLELEVGGGVGGRSGGGIAHLERFYCFDLSNERLCRMRLLRARGSASGDYVLLVTMHHSVSDGWSLGIFFRELVSLYRAYAKGEASPLAPLPVQYADYAQWQRRWLQGEVLEQQVSYWREQLAGLPPLLTLPTDRPRRPSRASGGTRNAFRYRRLWRRSCKG